MRIFYANVIEQNAGWGAEWFMNKGFRALGHITHCVDYRKYRHRLYRYFLNAPESDVFLLQRGDYFPISLIESVQIPRFFWASELVSRCRDQDRLLRTGLFDHIFLHSNECLEAIVSEGWVDRSKCSVLLNGFDEIFHYPIPDTRKDIDVLFVGSMTLRRKKILSRVNSSFNVTIASAFGEELVRLFNRAKIVLNIHAEDYSDTETRVFEALGCGAFLLTERLSSENPFSEQDLAQFDSSDDLIDKTRYYLAHDQERESIARHGYTSALNGHTYTHRAQGIVEIMSKYVTPEREVATPMVKQSIGLHLYGISEPIRWLMSCGQERGRILVARGKRAVKSQLPRQQR